jgi:hypothetical protein
VEGASLIDLTPVRPPVTAATPTTEPIATVTPTATIEPTPVVESIDRLVFAVVGDSRRDTNLYTQLLDKIVEDGNVFLANTGDLVERGTQENFDRFYRVDRAHSQELGGAGLGLAIARELARAHDRSPSSCQSLFQSAK